MSSSMFQKAAALFLFVLLLVFGCGDDDSGTTPEGNTGSEIDTLLVGDWDVSRMISVVEGVADTLTEGELNSAGMIWTLKFESDGSMEQVTNMGGPVMTMPGTWGTSADQLSMSLTSPGGGMGQITYEYSVNGSIMDLTWSLPSGPDFEAEFTKQEPTP